MLKYYPINLVLAGKRCVVIGGGKVAERKVRRLLECGARVLVVSPVIASSLRALADKARISLFVRKFAIRDLKGAYLVIAATAERSVNAAVSSYCLERNILVNIVDSPKECNFIVPSLVRRGALTIAISTDGVSPALSKKIRQDLEKIFGAEYAALLRLLKEIRPQVLKRLKSAAARKKFFSTLFRPGMRAVLKRCTHAKAMRRVKRALDDSGA